MAAQSHRPLKALVYRGPASGEGLSEAVAQLLESCPRRFEVRFAGPNEAIDVSAQSLNEADLYAQPGGPDLDDAWAHMKAYRPLIRDFVSSGGRYLGFCLGAYLAGHTPGFGLLPRGADTDAENDQDGAEVTTDADTLIRVNWTFTTGTRAGQTAMNQWVYFQEGACICDFVESETSIVLGRYSKSGNVAASLNQYGKGWVGLIGPHPEATQEWYSIENLRCPDPLPYEMGRDFIEATILGGQNEAKTGDSA